MESVPTVQVHDPKHPGRFLNINASDFKAGVHTLFSEPRPRLRTVEEPAPAVPSDGQGIPAVRPTEGHTRESLEAMATDDLRGLRETIFGEAAHHKAGKERLINEILDRQE